MGILEKCNCNLKVDNVELDRSETRSATIEDAVKVLLQALGEDINREGIRKTPLRVAKALQDGTRGYNQNVKEIVCGALFPEAGLESGVGSAGAGGVGGLVIVRDLDMFSYCESCLIPFHVKCHVGYIPSDERVVGLSKLSRVAQVFASRLQEPHRLANEVCAALQQTIKPTGVAVVLQCSHINFPNLESPLFDQGPVKLSVISGSGVFDDDKADIWNDFLGLLRFKGVSVDDDNLSWCPSQITYTSDSNLLAAVSSILSSLGEDPLRKELVETPARFIKWMMNFKNASFDLNMKQLLLVKPSICNSSEQHICSELNLPFWSQCEHHLLPFHGVVHVGYYSSSSNQVDSVGKALLQSIVHFYGFKLQVQERLTRQIAEVVSAVLGEDIIVVVEASHTCMISRGIEKLGSSTATIAVLGRFSTDPTARDKFLQIIPNSSF